MDITRTDSAPTTLSTMAVGKEAIVKRLAGGQSFRSRAANLGFTAGALLTVVQNFGHGPMLVSVRGTLVALGRAEAAQVMVSGQ